MDSILAKFADSPHVSDIADGKRESPFLPWTSLQFLKQHSTRVKRLREGYIYELSSDRPIDTSYHQDLSTASIMKLAKAQLLELNYQKTGVLSYVGCRFGTQKVSTMRFLETWNLH